MMDKMTRTLRRRTALMFSLGLVPALSGCGGTKKPAIIGTQIPVLPESYGLDVAVDAPAVTVPAASALAAWPQVFGGPAHAPGNAAAPTGLKTAWTAGIGEGGGYRQPLQASPIMAEGKVFAMDANGNVSAFSASSGAQLWKTYTRPKHTSVANIGGGIGYDSGTVYASTGYSELLSIDAGAGKIKWRQELDFPARSAPTIAGGIVAVVTQNDLLLTFDAAAGTAGWRFVGKVTDSPTSVAVTGAPAFDSGIFVAGFSSGTLAALDAASGTPIWEQSFASSFGQASPLDFSDIVAAPVIAGGVVYAIGLGKTMLAIDLRSGAKVWERDTAGNQTICAAGGFVYVMNTAQTLAAIHADDGLVCWTTQMPAFVNLKKKKKPINWTGPVMVNSLLLFASDHGEMAFVDPVSGAMTSRAKIGGPADLSPIAAGGLLVLLTRDATLTAYG
jgi:outer membrane protein assembly factor BamB